jgi:hypothetical protein
MEAPPFLLAADCELSAVVFFTGQFAGPGVRGRESRA